MSTTQQFYQFLLAGGGGVAISKIIQSRCRHNKRFSRWWQRYTHSEKQVIVALGSIGLTVLYWIVMLLVGAIPNPPTTALKFEAFLTVLAESATTFTAATITHGAAQTKSPAKKRRAKRVVRQIPPATSEQSY